MSTAISVPPALRTGEQLTLQEFMHRWDSEPDLKKAELIEGVVYAASPVSNEHSTADALVITWLRLYAASTKGTSSGSNGTWLMLQSAPQPDTHLRLLPECGGQSRVEGSYCAGAPELAVEVCQTNALYDLGPKLRLYQRAGVHEYLTFILQSKEIIWRSLVNGRYKPIVSDADGLLRSRVFPGLWLDPEAALGDDGARVFAVLQEGLASPEHQEFAQSLRRQLP